MKLPNGYGSVYKLPGTRRKPYAVRVQGTDEKRHYIGYYETKEYISFNNFRFSFIFQWFLNIPKVNL